MPGQHLCPTMPDTSQDTLFFHEILIKYKNSDCAKVKIQFEIDRSFNIFLLHFLLFKLIKIFLCLP
jgi:hypothetical protein